MVGAAVVGAALCARIPGLGKAQRELCRRSPHTMPAVGEGAELGLQECRHQFRNHRWNCSHVVDDQIFGHVVVVGSREAAFMYAISAAGITYSVTAACSRGNITACGCESSLRTRKEVPPNGWEWGGCSADISYGMRFARRFLDAREIEGDGRSLMNLHNNKAGRKIVKAMLQTECKCHGVSGSCTVRTCWRTLPSFRQIGDALMKKYYRARPVVAITPPASPTIQNAESLLRSSEISPILGNDAKSQGGNANLDLLLSSDEPMEHGWPVKRSGSVVVQAPIPPKQQQQQHQQSSQQQQQQQHHHHHHHQHQHQQLQQQQQHQQQRRPHLVLKRPKFDSGSSSSSITQKRTPKRSELVFLQQSPNYCEPDLDQGSLGTQGRYCNRTSRGTDGCDLMCCGRGYNTHQFTRSWQCNCKFQWCCKVICDVCSERTEEYTCK